MSSDGVTLLYRRAGSGIDKGELRAFAQRLHHEVAEGLAFTCVFTDDRELQRLNRMFLDNDYPTDVLSFPASADIAVSVDRARDQAAEHGHTLVEELQILLLHGVLHLLGHDHVTDRGAMSRLERKWRRELGLKPGLIERSRP